MLVSGKATLITPTFNGMLDSKSFMLVLFKDNTNAPVFHENISQHQDAGSSIKPALSLRLFTELKVSIDDVSLE